jgi:hypothetical protein
MSRDLAQNHPVGFHSSENYRCHESQPISAQILAQLLGELAVRGRKCHRTDWVSTEGNSVAQGQTKTECKTETARTEIGAHGSMTSLVLKLSELPVLNFASGYSILHRGLVMQSTRSVHSLHFGARTI